MDKPHAKKEKPVTAEVAETMPTAAPTPADDTEKYTFLNTTISSENFSASSIDDLTSFYLKMKGHRAKRITIDMSRVEFFDADMCAVLGALIDDLKSSDNQIEFLIPKDSIKDVLQRNGFLCHYGYDAIPDDRHTTIPYQKFLVNQEGYFADYIKQAFTLRGEMPAMSKALTKKFYKSISEIFENAIYHSETKLGIFTCGQYYKRREKLSFTVVDRGIGFYEKIRPHKDLGDSPVEYIDWATKRGHSTKDKVGGLGLDLLTQFLDLNQGCLRIISGTGHWERQNGLVEKKTLRNFFPGTVINLEINTADSSSYVLKSELTLENIL